MDAEFGRALTGDAVEEQHVARGLARRTLKANTSRSAWETMSPFGDDDDIGELQHRADLAWRVDSREIVDDADRERALDMRRAAVAKPGALGDQDVGAGAPSPGQGNRRCC